MRLKDLAALCLSLASLITAIGGLIQAFRAKEDSAQVYQQAAEGVADNADELEQLKHRIKELEGK